MPTLFTDHKTTQLHFKINKMLRPIKDRKVILAVVRAHVDMKSDKLKWGYCDCEACLEIRGLKK